MTDEKAKFDWLAAVGLALWAAMVFGLLALLTR